MFRSVFDADYQGYGIFLDKVLKPLFGDKLEVLPVAEDNPTNVSEEAMERARIKKIVRVANIAATFDRDTMEVFDITLEDNVNIARARVGIQQLIRRGLFVHTHAFMIFHAEHPEGENWRFSYARKLGTVGSMTDAKRYTYLFGKNMHCRTAIDRFAVLAAGEITDQKLLDAFNVEALSDEFFEEYRKKYAAFVKYITGKEFVKENGKWVEKAGTPNEELMAQFRGDDKAVRDYVKKMMGRITFLHFLQKKGWMNGDVNYMQHLFESSDQKANYLEAVLEPLFFGILNTKPQNRIKLFTERHWDLSLLDQWESFPYLNGGLFEEDEDDRLDVVFPENYFVGLFNFYSRFNFTVDENDPDDAEVGVDPEMLGKIFENLLEDNKDKGAFYTPKEIVRYMCQESLTAYLVGKTGLDEESIRAFVVHPYDEVENFTNQQQNQIYNALEGVKICDPAIGSGAFPMGLLNELVRCEEALLGEREEEHQSRAGLKKYIIQNNIYGVDIEKGAIDIARLRFWLSIVVDEENPSPLPNLDYKIMQGNSLLESYKKVDLSHLLAEEGIGEEMQGGLFSDLDVIQDTREELAAYLEAYFNCSDHEEKLRIQQDIRTAINVQLSARNLNVDFGDLDIAANQEFFLWHTWFSDVFNRPSDCEKGFDIVIGNPPYGANIDSLVKVYEKRYPNTSHGFKDIYKYFFDRGLELCHANAILCYITPNTYLRQPRYGDLRRVLLGTQIRQILNLGEDIFEEAVVPVAITILSNCHIQSNDIMFVDLTKVIDKDNAGEQFANIQFVSIKQSSWDNTNNNSFIEDIRENRDNEVTLDRILSFKDAGINYQRVNIGLSQKGKSDLSKRLMYEGPKESEEDVEFWKGVDINEFFIEPHTGRYCRSNIQTKEGERVILNADYFSICPKLIWRQTASYPICTIDYIGRWFGRSIQAGLIKPEFKDRVTYEYLCGVLNSSYIRNEYEKAVKETGRVFPQVKLEKLKPLPIVIPTLHEKEKIEGLVNKIIESKNRGLSVDRLKHELDIEVESLYSH